MKITFFTPDARKRDLDNLLAAMKPALDGMAQAIGVDDALFRPLLIDKVKAQSKDKARVEIELMGQPENQSGGIILVSKFSGCLLACGRFNPAARPQNLWR